jgi:hypothetical protein
MGGACGTYEGKTLFGRLRHRWEGVKMDLQETGYVGVEWFDLENKVV